MIPELGHYALVLALFVALVQSGVPLAGAATGNAAWMGVARPAAVAQMLLVLVAYGALTWAHVVSDFSVMNVVQNSHSAKPMLYKVSGVWGNHEGSMMLWIVMLTVFGAAVAVFGRNLPPTLKARVLAVQGLVGIGFLLFILTTSNPFIRVVPAPLDGNDLNPLLQDPGLAFHPPFLYAGYVGFSIAFSFAVAALIEGRVDPAWARWVRPWTLAAWSTLTAGIALGSWWAYYELGWGGWWYWDPVENASFMPWLAGTALLHSAIVVEKRDALKTWTILLAIITFSLSLMGTFLVRSGILTSVHAFAVDPARGVFILVLLGIATGGSLLLYSLRAPSLKAGGLFAPISREGSLVLNNLLLSTATATVFIGTLYPLFLDVLKLGKVSVGAPFFNATFVPVAIPMVIAMVVGPFLAWKRGDLPGALTRLWSAGVAVVVCVAIAAYITNGGGPLLALVGIALAAWAFFGSLAEFAERIRLFRVPLKDSWTRAAHLPRSAWGMTIAHACLGISILGMTGTSAWQTEVIQAMKPGETAQLAAYSVRFDSVAEVQGANFRAEEGVFTVTKDGALIATLKPQRRSYPVTRMTTTESAIHTTVFSDVYIALGDPTQNGTAWIVRLYHHPLVPWIWLGALGMMAGGLVSLSDRRFRVGAPERRRAAKPTLQPAE
ncbi:heme lyase CcmF/NrfE family subunit [Azospirillum rugosum]|uniref:Cytochrome c-type biogenesis protein CcmF n=1 Tax=Azospirillum rugosum TaxID=416170 RepID=A0ABS4SZ12_9PROT|nr:heme lyase CcmF/NrfE family subunit [Azospirillum rugosum]MBP2296635.1 cytochrome c-type biogenesis protein CcmF [Azospirillum rugosum]MDQ0530306.1 cytochrome c-type biogenesis protein CcmF [Azospirillum rugosum]